MSNNGLLPVSQRVYNILLKTGKEYIFNREFEHIVLNMRFSEEFFDFSGVRHELATLGLTKRNIDKVCSYLAWKTRFSLDDIYYIKKELLSAGYLQYQGGHRLYIKKQ
jgi:hypothetical protein